MKKEQVEELLLQALETELGGVQVYRSAVSCAVNDELREEWQKYGEQTREHVRIMQQLLERVGMDTERETPGRSVVREKGSDLVAAMEMALRKAGGVAAQLVAAECVVNAETKDHQNWQLIGEVAKKSNGDLRAALQEAYDVVEDQEDEHLYHTKGWCRELWLESLGLPAQLPPPEEERGVKSAIEEAQVQAERTGEKAPVAQKRSPEPSRPGTSRSGPSPRARS